MKITCVYG